MARLKAVRPKQIRAVLFLYQLGACLSNYSW